MDTVTLRRYSGAMTAQPGLAPSAAEITSLFTTTRRPRAARPSESVCPRTAFQRALYGRTLLVQVHEGREARVDEALTGDVLTLPQQLLDWPRRFATAVAVAAGETLLREDDQPLDVTILAATPQLAERAARTLRAAHTADRLLVRVVDGDVAAWVAQGLPVR